MSKPKKLEEWGIDQLIPYPNNAKIHTKAQIEKIAKSIQKHGLVNPPSVEADGTIITGHGRKLALASLGWTHVPVVVRYDLSKAEAAALRIADNKVAEGETDTRMLHEELRWLQNELEDDLTILGFDDKELTFLTADLGEIESDLLLSDLSLSDSLSPSDAEEAHEAEPETDQATIGVDKALGFKKLTNAENRALQRYMAILTDANDADARKAAFFEQIEKVIA